ncbi:hypothetical protein [Massilia sp. BSC265]|uniref:hypothetical protein n=1 Tax=Massilia sp. BSC265 TaxID=1549812 RepID=UPI0004E872CA|nr:hypothetical protein [Massilia sp. BSC265]KFI08343.1 hypothetical protein JN27_04020 [Massilia sp. BSC265]
MKAPTILIHGTLATLAVLAAGCDRGRTASEDGILQTKYPGQVSAGGKTAGTIIAQTAKPTVDATYAGGTPGIAGGSGGTTSGAETGGTVRETGQGPTSGVTPPSGTQAGTRAPSGDYGEPKAPAPGTVEAPAATNIAPKAPADQGSIGRQQ